MEVSQLNSVQFTHTVAMWLAQQVTLLKNKSYPKVTCMLTHLRQGELVSNVECHV